jgi:hypothetical protein
MIVHERKANATKIQDGAEQLSNANARPCCRPHVHLTQSKKAISPIHDCHVQLLVVASRQEWHCDRRKVGGRLHALSRQWPPRRCGCKRLHHTMDAVGITRGESSARQASADLCAKEECALARKCVVETISETRNTCERFNRSEERTVMARSVR